MSRPDATDFTQLFLTDTPMMDTRAPVERFTCATPFIYVRVKQVAVNACELREQLSRLFRSAVHSGFQYTA